MMTKGQDTFRFRSNANAGTGVSARIGGGADARILKNCYSVKAQRSPPRSFARTAIYMPGLGNHSHQLGSNPSESNAQLSTLAGVAPCVKCRMAEKAPAARPPALPPRPRRRCPQLLFYFDGCANIGEFLGDGSSFVLANAFLHRLRSAIHQILGFLQAEAGDFAYRLDDIDLVRAGAGQHHGELSLLFDG